VPEHGDVNPNWLQALLGAFGGRPNDAAEADEVLSAPPPRVGVPPEVVGELLNRAFRASLGGVSPSPSGAPREEALTGMAGPIGAMAASNTGSYFSAAPDALAGVATPPGEALSEDQIAARTGGIEGIAADAGARLAQAIGAGERFEAENLDQYDPATAAVLEMAADPLSLLGGVPMMAAKLGILAKVAQRAPEALETLGIANSLYSRPAQMQFYRASLGQDLMGVSGIENLSDEQMDRIIALGLQGDDSFFRNWLLDIEELDPQLTDEIVDVVRRSGLEAPPEYSVSDLDSGSLGMFHMPDALKRYWEQAGSKVTDNVLHGTGVTYVSPDKAKFDRDGVYGPGFYSTEGAHRMPGGEAVDSVTDGYARIGFDPKGADEQSVRPQVRSQFLHIRVPFDIDAKLTTESRDALVEAATRADPHLGANLEARLPWEGRGTGDDAYDAMLDVLAGDRELANNLLYDAGFDGITHIGGKNTSGDPHRVWIAFDPEQVFGGEDGVERLVEQAKREGFRFTPEEQAELDALMRDRQATREGKAPIASTN
jgi:hypothetical protein